MDGDTPDRLLSATVVRRDGEVVVTVTDELDLATTPAFERLMTSILARGPSRVLLDLTSVPYLASTGLAVIAQAHLTLLRFGGVLEVVAANRQTLRTLRMTGMDRQFTVHDSLDALPSDEEG